ncbi:unnamed protein product [Anisakis simplex]|uniref:Mab-21 domain-containing protein n=1 Tax=Anisakis simplex TaxID=6269 RepID=A0A0M3JS02_ANISI|nr:unnamed protein product [Anisakis simplex]
MLLRYIGNSCQVMCKHAVQKRYLHAGIVDTSTTRNGTAASVIERPVLHSNNVSSCSRTCVLLLHQGQPRTLCHTKQFLAKGAQRFYKFPLYLTSLFIDAVWPLCQKAQFCVADCKESESLDNIMERMTTTLEECLNHLLPDLGSFHCSHAFLHEEPSIDNYWHQQIRRKIDDFDSILFVAPQMRGYASKQYSREVWSTCQRVMNQLEDRLAWRTAWFGAWDQWPSSNLFESIPMQLYLLRRDNKQHTLVVPITSIFPDFNTQALLPRILPKEVSLLFPFIL